MATPDSKDSLKGSKEDSTVESDTKYSVLYESGLEAVDQDNAPEVVPGSNLDRKSSLLKPEAYDAAPYYSDKQEHQSSYEAPQALGTESEGMQAMSMDSKEMMMGEQEVSGRHEQRQQRRCCGIRRKLFVIIVVVVAVVICIGIILGAVLGTLLPKRWANATLQTWSGTGLASTGLASTLDGDGSGRLLTYYQDPQGRIIENSYMDGTWTLENRANIDSSVVTNQAAYGSPLAAISYKYNGKTYRQVFYVTSTGAFMTVNSTETTAGMAINWSAAHVITHDKVDPNGVGLAACWGSGTMNGISAFYPSQYGWIAQMKWVFGQDGWQVGDGNNGGVITSSDSASGMGCAVKSSPTKMFLNLYYRSTASGNVKQAFIEYKGKIFWSYSQGATAWSNETIAKGSDIAVCDDSSQTEYVYYQLQGGQVTRGIINPTFKNYEAFDNLQGATVGSKLACSFVDGGSMLLFQNRSSTDTIYASDVSRSGVSISNFAVP